MNTDNPKNTVNPGSGVELADENLEGVAGGYISPLTIEEAKTGRRTVRKTTTVKSNSDDTITSNIPEVLGGINDRLEILIEKERTE